MIQGKQIGTGRDRGHWRSRWGSLAAGTGAAIGLGTLWTLPGAAARHAAPDGGAGGFLAALAACLALVAMPVLLAELAVGRRGQSNAVGAFKRVRKDPNTTSKGIGALAIAASALLVVALPVVAGASIEYVRLAWQGSFEPASEEVDELAGCALLRELEAAKGYDPARSLAERPEDAAETARAAIRWIGWRTGAMGEASAAPAVGGSALEELAEAQASYAQARRTAGFFPERSVRQVRDQAFVDFRSRAESVDERLSAGWREAAALWSIRAPGERELEGLRLEKAAELLAERRAAAGERAEREILALARGEKSRAAHETFRGDPLVRTRNQLAFVGIAVFIVLAGLGGGIERVAKVLFPLALLVLVALAGRAAFLEGRSEVFQTLFGFAGRGFEPGTLLDALRASVLLLALGAGIHLAAGGYETGEANLNVSAAAATVVAAAGFLGVSFLVLLAGRTSGLAAGADPAFHVLPAFFAQVEHGRWMGLAFYVLLGLGALSALALLLEVVVSFAVDEWRWPRWLTALLAGGLLAGAGVAASRPGEIDVPGLTGSVDAVTLSLYLATTWLLPLGALLLTLFVGWGTPSWEKQEEIRYGPISGVLYFVWDHLLMKFVAPIGLLLVLLDGAGQAVPLIDRFTALFG